MVKSNLSRYVRLVMKQRGLTLRDVEARSDGKITDGYVADILRGAANNPSAGKIKALARGLGVDPHTLFEVICGPLHKNTGDPTGEDVPEVGPFLELMQQVAENPALVKIVEEAVLLLPGERAVVLKSLKSFNERKGRQEGDKSVRARK